MRRSWVQSKLDILGGSGYSVIRSHEGQEARALDAKGRLLMGEKTLKIRHEAGLHARPASLFVKTSNRFACDIEVVYDGREVNAKSILSVLTLGAGQDAVVTVRAEGEDAEEALEALAHLVESNFEVDK